MYCRLSGGCHAQQQQQHDAAALSSPVQAFMYCHQEERQPTLLQNLVGLLPQTTAAGCASKDVCCVCIAWSRYLP